MMFAFALAIVGAIVLGSMELAAHVHAHSESHAHAHAHR